MSGLALYIALAHRSPSLAGRMAIMTGDADAASFRSWLAHNPCPVLKKPFDLSEIVGWVRGVRDVAGRERGSG
jgi:hypothetical protein